MRRTLVGLALGLAACSGPPAADDEASSSESSGESSSESSDSLGETSVDDESDSGEDALPPAPTLASPADQAIAIPLSTELCWNPVEDPEGEPLRYRVFIDDLELTEGALGEGPPGYAGPCVGPLLFAFEREYAWNVEAFEVDDPTRSSPRSETWTFTTVDDGLTSTVFTDDFSEDLGWQIEGDAGTGAWVRGDPQPATLAGASTQPGACAGGTDCYFTGQNPAGVADDQDVSGGATVLISPAFDLGGAATATVRLTRFFFKSDPDPDPALVIELLVPDANEPDGWAAFELESIAAPTLDEPANLWTPREWAACGAPMRDGSRLRITARDPGAGVLEAAIDSVSVHAHDDASVCAVGEGGICDPTQGPAACPDSLLCCAQGVINAGINRCEVPVAGLDFAAPTPTPESPGNGPLGCDAPDLIVDPQVIEPLFTEIFISDSTCELLEGCVGTTGWRKVMLFTVSTPNIGSDDLALGIPANLPELFHYSDCHDHYHFDEYARYELRAGDDVIATGHKQAFCLLDTTSWAWPLALPQFDCANQGISRGFSDFYESGLPCQWVDVTDAPAGDYVLRVTLNQARPGHALPMLVERDYGNDMIEVPITLP
ncbi:lysyl oxidase family protein [Nannocystaceae bacterium ST9]